MTSAAVTLLPGQHLTTRQLRRRIVLLLAGEGYTQAEIAALLRITQPAVSKTLQRAAAHSSDTT